MNLREKLTKGLPANHTATRDFNVIIGTRRRTKDLLIRGRITPAQADQNLELACRRRMNKRSL